MIKNKMPAANERFSFKCLITNSVSMTAKS